MNQLNKIYPGAYLESVIVKTCEYCENQFEIQKTSQTKLRFCSKSCSAKWRMRQPEFLKNIHNDEVARKRGISKSNWYKTEAAKKELDRIKKLNPTKSEAVRQKISDTLKRIGHKPIIRGGNGHGMTVPQSILKDCLRGNWLPEYAVSLGKKKDGYPTNYKIDLANMDLKIGIEVDGYSHSSRKKLDIKKDNMLKSLGWEILRFSNDEINLWILDRKSKHHRIFKELSKHKLL